MDRIGLIWSMSTRSEIHVLKGHSNYVTSVAFSSVGTYLVSGSNDRTVRFWNVLTGMAVRDPQSGHPFWVNSLAFSPKGYEFSPGSNEDMRVWDIRAQTSLEKFKAGETNSGLNEDELSSRWNASRAHSDVKNDGWARDGGKLPLWVPLQYRSEINGGTKLVIGAQGRDTMSPEVDYRKIFKYSGKRWADVYSHS